MEIAAGGEAGGGYSVPLAQDGSGEASEYKGNIDKIAAAVSAG